MAIHRYLVNTVNLALAAGFRVFIAKKGNYGFITDNQGSTILSIQFDGLMFSSGGNYRAVKANDGKQVGQGWRIGEDWPSSKSDIVNMFNAAKCPPYWATKGIPVALTTLESYLGSYQKHCNYIEITEVVPVNS